MWHFRNMYLCTFVHMPCLWRSIFPFCQGRWAWRWRWPAQRSRGRAWWTWSGAHLSSREEPDKEQGIKEPLSKVNWLNIVCPISILKYFPSYAGCNFLVRLVAVLMRKHKGHRFCLDGIWCLRTFYWVVNNVLHVLSDSVIYSSRQKMRKCVKTCQLR